MAEKLGLKRTNKKSLIVKAEILIICKNKINIDYTLIAIIEWIWP